MIKKDSHALDTLQYSTGQGVGIPQVNPHLRVHRLIIDCLDKIVSLYKHQQGQVLVVDEDTGRVETYPEEVAVRYRLPVIGTEAFDKAAARAIFKQGSMGYNEYSEFCQTLSAQTSPSLTLLKHYDCLHLGGTQICQPERVNRFACAHEWRKDSFFTTAVYETCLKCGKKKEDLQQRK